MKFPQVQLLWPRETQLLSKVELQVVINALGHLHEVFARDRIMLMLFLTKSFLKSLMLLSHQIGLAIKGDVFDLQLT